MSLNPWAKKQKVVPQNHASDILKQLKEDNRKAAVNARIAINKVATSGEGAIVALLEAAKDNTKSGGAA